MTIDDNERIVYLNPVAEQLSGVALSEVRGRNVRDFMADLSDDGQRIGEMLATCLSTPTTVRISEPISWRQPDGRVCALRATMAPIGDGREGAVLALNDVTDAVAFTSRLEHEATHDPLTGLPNRTLLLDRLRRTLARGRRSGKMVAVLFVDLDRFKRINDSLGHPSGDHVLRVVADRLTNAVRAEDTVARWGGDEFIVLMDSVNDRAAIAGVAAKIHDLLAREVANDEDEEEDGLVVSGSIGVSISPLDSEDADHLLSMADKAMYRVKLAGGDGFAFYSAEMNTWSRERLNIETALRRALVNREFELHYQPQIEIDSRRLVGIESLIRWRQPGIGLVRPDAFIPAAEECGLIRSIGEWVIHEAALQAARWAAEGLRLVPLAVNISARQCSDMAIVEVIGEALAISRINPAFLKVELTESTAMHNVDFVAALLSSVARLGVGVAVDDFGTGYSSLSCLKRFPISELKIDRSFVAGIAEGSNDAAIVRGTIALAHGMGMTVVGEGVENAAQLAFLAAQRCDVAQGYYFAQPLPADEIRSWLPT
jgi:diguanylate cyclase (GGDEF)-like protein/PAS domain S-box-containing protein